MRTQKNGARHPSLWKSLIQGEHHPIGLECHHDITLAVQMTRNLTTKMEPDSAPAHNARVVCTSNGPQSRNGILIPFWEDASRLSVVIPKLFLPPCDAPHTRPNVHPLQLD